MLRYAIYYESRLGRNDGNPLYVWNEMKERQKTGDLEIDHLAPHGDLQPFGKYDAHIWVDWGEDGLKGFLPYDPIYPPGRPLIYWASDTHLGYDYRLECAKKADVVFCAQREGVERMKADGVPHAQWLPHAVEPKAYFPFNYIVKKYDIAFVGHINSENRIDALDRMFREFPNFFYGQRLFEEAAQVYSNSKIVFNIAMDRDVNMRVFEALGTRSLLLTDDIPGIHDLFEDGKHLVLYRSLDEAVEKARYYMEHEDERARIAQAGYEEVMKNHTFKHRVNTIIEETKKVLGVLK